MRRQLKRIAAKLPLPWQQELKRVYFKSQIRRRRFYTNESEYALLPSLISPGDWVLDIGANIGQYTVRFSELVGERGRVIALEPVPATFELLASNASLMSAKNVTLINAAASDSAGVTGMEIPQFDDGLDNYYMARSSMGTPGFHVLSIAIDSLNLPKAIKLVKIDTEGSELRVLRGMVELLRKDHPVLVVEDNVAEVVGFLDKLGYRTAKIEGSSNRIFCWNKSARETLRSLIERNGMRCQFAAHWLMSENVQVNGR